MEQERPPKADFATNRRSDAGSAAAAPAPLHKFPPAPATPTQVGPQGIRFDFNDGCRILLPEGTWRVRLTDLDTSSLLFDANLGPGALNSPHSYYQRFGIEIWKSGQPVFRHDYSAENRDVVIHIRGGALGDTIGWFPYAVKFLEKHGCRLTCAMAEWQIPLFRDAYPSITFSRHEDVRRDLIYATYHAGITFKPGGEKFQPCDHRLVGTHRAVGYALGVDPAEARPTIRLPDDSRPIAEPYVCIAVQSTLQCKYWNNPDGWREVVGFLKQAGYRVVCIDQRRQYALDSPLNRIPDEAEDETGDRPLLERARWLKHADFFVGLASGLSWLAWAVETPVVMISGFSHPVTEFETPYRVINYHVCNSCWNDPRLTLDRQNFLWCPRHGGTPRQFECSRQISAGAVIAAIRKIPRFLGASAPVV
jgi:autotransporter strand-loop-strand O-heptosyltransferase